MRLAACAVRLQQSLKSRSFEEGRGRFPDRGLLLLTVPATLKAYRDRDRHRYGESNGQRDGEHPLPPLPKRVGLAGLGRYPKVGCRPGLFKSLGFPTGRHPMMSSESFFELHLHRHRPAPCKQGVGDGETAH
jgi:hypothetical protein